MYKRQLPQVFAKLDDGGAAPPRGQLYVVDFQVHLDGTLPPLDPAHNAEPQTVGEVARAIISYHFSFANSRFSLPVAGHVVRSQRKSNGFEAYWLEREDREHCLSWLTLALGRAVEGASGHDTEKHDRVAALRQRIDGIERPYGGWILLALATPWDQGDHELHGDLLADEQDLIEAGQSIGEPALMRFLSGEAPDASDPDCALDPDSRFPYARVAAFILRHAPELLPTTPGETLLAIESRHLAQEPVGDAPHFPSSVWTIAAADLDPNHATAILRDAFTRHTARGDARGQDSRAFLAIALWRHARMGQLDFLLDWFFNEPPRHNSYGFGRHRLAWACLGEDFRPLLRAILADDRVMLLDGTTFGYLALATNQALGREVAPFKAASDQGPTPAAVRHLRQAW